MGIYLNPPADGFEEILEDGFYVDKTGLITYTNQVMGTSRKLTYFSRPRRFGKSYAAQMLVAFYSKGADSRHLFENMKVASPPEDTKGQELAAYEQYRNQWDALFREAKDHTDLQKAYIRLLRGLFKGGRFPGFSAVLI